MNHLIFIFLLLVPINKKEPMQTGQYIYWINSAKVECTGANGPRQCYEVQKSEQMAEDGWKTFYDEIFGFDYEPGYIYKLLIQEVPLDPDKVPADASTTRYNVLREYEKFPDVRLKLTDIWILTDMEKNPISNEQFSNVPQLEINVSSRKVMGTDGCNQISGGITKVTPVFLEFGVMLGTMMACPDMNASDKFNALLGKVNTYAIQDNYLQLYDINEKPILRFKKVD